MRGHELTRDEADRKDVPIDFRFFDSLLRCAEDPEVGLGKFALGVRVGPGVRMPRLPSTIQPEEKVETRIANRPAGLSRGRRKQ